MNSEPEIDQPDRTSAQQCALLVEDNAHDHWRIRRVLDSSGRQLRLASTRNGDEAIAYLRGIGVYADRSAYPLPKLVLMDLKIPRRSGLEVLEWLRSDGGTVQQIPVVMLSASDLPSDIQQAYDHGANAYVVKPHTLDGLKRALENIWAFWIDENFVPFPTCS